MESQPQNPEFRNNPENFHPCISKTPYQPVGRIKNEHPQAGRQVTSLLS